MDCIGPVLRPGVGNWSVPRLLNCFPKKLTCVTGEQRSNYELARVAIPSNQGSNRNVTGAHHIGYWFYIFWDIFEALFSTRSVVVTELKSVIVFMFPPLCLFIMLFPVVVKEVVILSIWGGNFLYVCMCLEGSKAHFSIFLNKIFTQSLFQ